MHKTEKKLTLTQLTMIGVMAAAVFVASAFLQIPIPTALGNTRIHMGNILCLLSGMLLGAVPGGFAAGIGSMLFDLTNPLYIASAPYTFVSKFIMAWVCGRIIGDRSGSLHRKRWIVGAVSGQVVYILLYLGKNFFSDYLVKGYPLPAVFVTVAQDGVASLVNGIIAVCVAVPLGLALKGTVQRLSTHAQ